MDKPCQRIDAQTLRLERDFPGPIERVWAYLTQADKRAKWFCGGHWTLEAGGRAELIFNNTALSAPGDGPPPGHADHAGEVRMSGEIAFVDAPYRLELIWYEEDKTRSRVVFELREAGDRVRLVLTHSEISKLDHLRGAAAGWHTHIEIWQAIAVGRTPPSFWGTFNTRHAAYVAQIGV